MGTSKAVERPRSVSIRSHLRTAAVAVLTFVLPAPAVHADGGLLVAHDLVVDSMVSDRFTWHDSTGKRRVVVLAHNDGQVGPGGSRGGEMRLFKYRLPDGSKRVVHASGSTFAGFGYVVSHPEDSERCIQGPGIDPSALGHLFPGAFTRVFEGRHHAIFRFTQDYPRYCAVGTKPAAPLQVPVTIEWVVVNGRDNPLIALTWDLSAIPADTLLDDSRGPYGEMLFDGSLTKNAHSTIAGVGWGDMYKFTSTASPVSYDSTWTWNTPNTVPYVKLWTTDVDATMGTVLTQTKAQQDAGGYFAADRWGTTSDDGNACDVVNGDADHLMPCDFNWPYQSINYELDPFNPGASTNHTRLAWGTNFGFLGQTAYRVYGNDYYGGPIPDGSPGSTAPGWPRKSYSTFVVLGQHSLGPVEAAVGQVEAVQNVTITPTIGKVAASGPGGAGRTDLVTYSPRGWNQVYAAWTLKAASNQVDVTFNTGGSTLQSPLVIVKKWTSPGLPASVKLSGITLVQDVDYLPSLRPDAYELWITLKGALAGAAVRLEIAP